MESTNTAHIVDLIANGNVYCNSLTQYSRRKTIEVNIGDLKMGSMHPIRIQSMTTIDTLDTIGSVEQSIRMIESGCELIRITAPSVKEAQNLENIRKELAIRGYTTPIVADIHFTPNAAELAARIVQKVRINPGNYADKKRFENIDYTESSYSAELERIRDKFLPLIGICKEYGTAMRIGTNHGSLSDRILSRYGDTPLGMVESALEFIRICEAENYYNIVVSMKASNTQVMIQAYRLLCKKLADEGLKPYPLHLGVTEAGEGEDGRIKSAVGIGTLLEDGLGDTVRVSLTEDPEFEAPVAMDLVNRYLHRIEKSNPISQLDFQKLNCNSPINPFQYQKRKSTEVLNFGGGNVPRIIADLSQFQIVDYKQLKPIGHHYLPEPDKFVMDDQGADYVYTGTNPITYMLPNGLKQIVDFITWKQNGSNENQIPFINFEDLKNANLAKNIVVLVKANATQVINNEQFVEEIKLYQKAIIGLQTNNEHAMAELRMACFNIKKESILNPLVFIRKYPNNLTLNELQLEASTDIGALLIDGFGDGLLLQNDDYEAIKSINSLGFGILQAARTRMSKTEYISCPSCGRTLFDLQETTAMIRKKTDHLKGIKIGIMGCIVNGPGEMADADYGYVGVGKDKIALYRGQDVVNKSVKADLAVDQLIELIKEDGKWREPEILI